jgi:hypothetical protein
MKADLRYQNGYLKRDVNKERKKLPTILPTVGCSTSNYQRLAAPGGTSKSL